MMEDFPLFRKYSNNKNYFKIMSSNEFIEISVIGNKVVLKKIEAKIYPDKIFISDLINCNYPILKISEEEFSNIENQINTKN